MKIFTVLLILWSIISPSLTSSVISRDDDIKNNSEDDEAKKDTKREANNSIADEEIYERLVVFLYKNIKGDVKLYIPNAKKQMKISELQLDDTDILVKVETQAIKKIFQDNPYAPFFVKHYAYVKPQESVKDFAIQIEKRLSIRNGLCDSNDVVNKDDKNVVVAVEEPLQNDDSHQKQNPDISSVKKISINVLKTGASSENKIHNIPAHHEGIPERDETIINVPIIQSKEEEKTPLIKDTYTIPGFGNRITLEAILNGLRRDQIPNQPSWINLDELHPTDQHPQLQYSDNRILSPIKNNNDNQAYNVIQWKTSILKPIPIDPDSEKGLKDPKGLTSPIENQTKVKNIIKLDSLPEITQEQKKSNQDSPVKQLEKLPSKPNENEKEAGNVMDSFWDIILNKIPNENGNTDQYVEPLVNEIIAKVILPPIPSQKDNNISSNITNEANPTWNIQTPNPEPNEPVQKDKNLFILPQIPESEIKSQDTSNGNHIFQSEGPSVSEKESINVHHQDDNGINKDSPNNYIKDSQVDSENEPEVLQQIPSEIRGQKIILENRPKPMDENLKSEESPIEDNQNKKPIKNGKASSIDSKGVATQDEPKDNSNKSQDPVKNKFEILDTNVLPTTEESIIEKEVPSNTLAPTKDSDQKNILEIIPSHDNKNENSEDSASDIKIIKQESNPIDEKQSKKQHEIDITLNDDKLILGSNESKLKPILEQDNPTKPTMNLQEKQIERGNKPITIMDILLNKLNISTINDFDVWIEREAKEIVSVKSIDFNTLKQQIIKIFTKNLLTVTEDGKIIDAYGQMVPISEIVVRPVFIGPSGSFSGTNNGVKIEIPESTSFLEAILVSRNNNVLGTIPLGVTAPISHSCEGDSTSKITNENNDPPANADLENYKIVNTAENIDSEMPSHHTLNIREHPRRTRLIEFIKEKLSKAFGDGDTSIKDDLNSSEKSDDDYLSGDDDVDNIINDKAADNTDPSLDLISEDADESDDAQKESDTEHVEERTRRTRLIEFIKEKLSKAKGDGDESVKDDLNSPEKSEDDYLSDDDDVDNIVNDQASDDSDLTSDLISEAANKSDNAQKDLDTEQVEDLTSQSDQETAESDITPENIAQDDLSVSQKPSETDQENRKRRDIFSYQRSPRLVNQVPGQVSRNWDDDDDYLSNDEVTNGGVVMKKKVGLASDDYMYHRIIGGHTATGSGIPISNKGRFGLIANFE